MPNLRFAGALPLALFCLAGCSGSVTPPAGDPFIDFGPVMTRLAVFAGADVQAALADAKTEKDPVGELCWQVVLDNLPVIAPPAQAQTVGAASAIQRGRDLHAAIPRVADACAAILPSGLAALGGAAAAGL